MYKANGRTMMDNIARKWGKAAGQNQIRNGSTILTYYKSTAGSDRWTIQLNEGGMITYYKFQL